MSDDALAEALQKLFRAELALGDEIFLAADETKILSGYVWPRTSGPRFAAPRSCCYS